MLRGFFLIVVMLFAAAPALAAGDIESCRDAQAEPTARLAACDRGYFAGLYGSETQCRAVLGAV